MTIHKEGYASIIIVAAFLILLSGSLHYFLELNTWFSYAFNTLCVLFFLFIVHFFRLPNRVVKASGNQIIAPADGKVVVIEPTFDSEYFNEERIQVSIFMSPFNVHCNWVPATGIVKYFKYHPGKFLFAALPKASTENERTTLVIEAENKQEYLLRQIAGLVARRIVHYKETGDSAQQGDQFGFIKFGSRVDILLPKSAKIKVELEQMVTGRETIIAEW